MDITGDTTESNDDEETASDKEFIDDDSTVDCSLAGDEIEMPSTIEELEAMVTLLAEENRFLTKLLKNSVKIN